MKTFVNIFNELNESETKAYEIKKKVFMESGKVTIEDLTEEVTIEEITRLHNAFEDAVDKDEIQEIIYNISDGVLEDEVQKAFDQSIQDGDDLDTLKGLVITTLEDNAEYLDEAAPIDKKEKEDRLASLKTQLEQDGDQLSDDEKEAIEKEIADLETETLDEEEKIVWTSEVDTSEEAYNAAYDGWDDDEKPSYEDWLNSDFDAETDYIIQDLNEYVLPEIEKQVNDGLLFIVGNYNSNYPDFRPSGGGAVTLKGTEGLKNYLTRWDEIRITSENGELNIRAYDHDGSVSGTLCTVINDRNKILEELGYYKDYEDKNEAESEYENDLYYEDVDYKSFSEHPDLIIPIKNTINEAKENACKEKLNEGRNLENEFNALSKEEQEKYLELRPENRNDRVNPKIINDLAKKYNVDKDILYWVINIKGNIDESVEVDKDGNKIERDDKIGHVKKITVSKKTQDKMADEYNKKQELKLKEESIKDIRKDSVEKGLLTETGEWDESDEDLIAWKEALRTAAEEITKNIGGEVKIVKGFDAYQGPFAIIATPKHGDIELWSGPEEDLLDAKLAHVGWIEGSISEISELLNMDTIPEENLISESLKEIDTKTYNDEDEAAYYRNKELYSTSHLARHREAMEKAKKACEDKNIKLEEKLNNHEIITFSKKVLDAESEEDLKKIANEVKYYSEPTYTRIIEIINGDGSVQYKAGQISDILFQLNEDQIEDARKDSIERGLLSEEPEKDIDKVKNLKLMDLAARSINDEDYIDIWLSEGVPDEASEDDYIDIASYKEIYDRIEDLFKKLMHGALKDGLYNCPTDAYEFAKTYEPELTNKTDIQEETKIYEAEVKGLKTVKSQGNIFMLEDETKKIIVGENYNESEGLIENAEIYENKEEANKDYLNRCGITLEEFVEKDLSKDLFGSEANKRASEDQRALEKYLDLAREVKAGNNDTITLDSAKQLLKNAYIKAKGYYSFEPEEIDRRITKDIPDLFGDLEEGIISDLKLKHNEKKTAKAINTYRNNKTPENKNKADEEILKDDKYIQKINAKVDKKFNKANEKAKKIKDKAEKKRNDHYTNITKHYNDLADDIK